METTRFPLSALEPGMTLSADILRDGSVLLEAGTEIGERVLKQLAAWGMTEVEVRGVYDSIDRIARRAGDAEVVEMVDLGSIAGTPEALAAAAPTASALPKGYSADNGATYVVEESPVSGEVRFDGGIVFRNAIAAAEELSIHAGGSVRVMGDCTTDKIPLRIVSERGSVEIDGVAKGDGLELTAAGSVKAKTFTKARIRAEDGVEISSEDGKIEGGTVEAGRRIRTPIAGNLAHEETHLTITMHWLKKAFLEVQRIQKRIGERQAEVEKLKKVIELVRMLGEKIATLDPERKASLALQTKQFIEAQAEIKELSARLEETRGAAQGEVRSVDDCPLVFGRVYPNVKITIGGTSLLVNAKADRIGYYLKEKRLLAKSEGP